MMVHKAKLIQWVLDNKQVGKTFNFEEEGEQGYSSVAIQKWNNVFNVYVDEILLSQMNAENFQREEILVFDEIESALAFISKNTLARLADLTPCKGQKIFNPQLD